ncbi:MAG: sigma 54-interacting transcriptional regulator [Firmicutes bacterium]|nr:sigma 54-interacting transcriptional regulator [Bacillota bacterium]
MKAKEYQKVITELANKADLAIHIVDKTGKSIVYNENMAIIEKIQREEVLSKPFLDVFSHIEKEDSTIWQALTNHKATINVEQVYQNAYGKQVISVNSTYPVESDDGEVIAAFEIARDITGIKDMSETLLALQSEAQPAKAKKSEKPQIRKYTFDDIQGNNREFKSVINRAKRAANSDASVFIYGETGTGKELFAQSIHYASERAKGPFLAQNCAAIPESLLEGILFGTTKGGFTGAVDRQGLFEQANGGTLLLDEISAMPYDLQSKLLRVLQEEYIRRVGGSKDIPFVVRIIATVISDPQKLIEEGKLRSDLYYRLNIINITIPPLRERRDDIMNLTEEFLKKDNEKFGKELWMLSEKAKEKLVSYDYPGNVRELENLITAAVSMADREHVLTENMLNFDVGTEPKKQIDKFELAEDDLDEYLAKVETGIIKEALAASDGNISRAAELLNIKRQTLQHKLKKYGLW